MTKDYHLTQEQALEIAKQTLNQRTLNFALKSELQAYVNAALDKVLGEPVGEVVNLNNQPVGVPSLTENGWSLKVGQRLYTPRREKMSAQQYTWKYISYDTYGLVAADGEIVATIHGGANIWHYKAKEYIDKQSAMSAAEKDIGATKS